MARHRRDASTVTKRELQPVLINIADQFERKLEAMALYKSQSGESFASSKDCTEALRRYDKAINNASGMVDRYWSAGNMPRRT